MASDYKPMFAPTAEFKDETVELHRVIEEAIMSYKGGRARPAAVFVACIHLTNSAANQLGIPREDVKDYVNLGLDVLG